MKAKALRGVLILGLLWVFAGATRAQVGFPRADFPVGNSPQAVAVADFNGDGHRDLAVVNFGDHTVSVLLGAGDGTFGPRADFATGLGPVAVAAADFNGDSLVDLAVANNMDSSVSILIGRGDGTFAAKLDFPAGTAPSAAAIGDFNGDARPDVATANAVANTVSVLLGNGDGTFAPHVDFPTSTEPRALVVRDFNGDGKADLATANAQGNNLSVLRGHGDGTFAARIDFPAGTNPVSLTAADFGADGKLDLAAANSAGAFSNAISVLIGNGDGTFNFAAQLGIDTQPMAVTAVDFDSDGKPDLVAAAPGFSYAYYYYGYYVYYVPSKVSILRGLGNGTFAARVDSDVAGVVPRGLAAADFNSDGWADLAVVDESNARVVILLQAPMLAADPAQLSFGGFQAVGVPSPPQTVTLNSTGSIPVVINSVVLSGSDPGDFSIVADTCSGATLPAGSDCSVTVTFTPSSVGSASAAITIASNAAGNSGIIGLTGAGVPNAPVLQLSATAISFGDQLIGGAQSDSLTLSNDGGVSLNLGAFTISGAQASDFAAGSCSPPVLAPGQSCSVQVTFRPTGAGARTSTLSISSDAAGSPHAVTLTGQAAQLTIAVAAGSSATVTVPAGQGASLALEFQAGSMTALLSLTCVHSIPGASCAMNPNTVQLTGAGPVSATVAISTTARSAVPPLGTRPFAPQFQPVPLFWLLAALAMLTLMMGLRRGSQRWRWSAVPAAALLLSAGVLSGCGGGSTPMPRQQAGTPAGPYQVTVTANAGSVAQSIAVSVNVQ